MQQKALGRAQLEASHAYKVLAVSEANEQQAVALTRDALSKEADASQMLSVFSQQAELLWPYYRASS